MVTNPVDPLCTWLQRRRGLDRRRLPRLHRQRQPAAADRDRRPARRRARARSTPGCWASTATASSRCSTACGSAASRSRSTTRSSERRRCASCATGTSATSRSTPAAPRPGPPAAASPAWSPRSRRRRRAVARLGRARRRVRRQRRRPHRPRHPRARRRPRAARAGADRGAARRRWQPPARRCGARPPPLNLPATRDTCPLRTGTPRWKLPPTGRSGAGEPGGIHMSRRTAAVTAALAAAGLVAGLVADSGHVQHPGRTPHAHLCRPGRRGDRPTSHRRACASGRPASATRSSSPPPSAGTMACAAASSSRYAVSQRKVSLLGSRGQLSGVYRFADGAIFVEGERHLRGLRRRPRGDRRRHRRLRRRARHAGFGQDPRRPAPACPRSERIGRW